MRAERIGVDQLLRGGGSRFGGTGRRERSDVECATNHEQEGARDHGQRALADVQMGAWVALITSQRRPPRATDA